MNVHGTHTVAHPNKRETFFLLLRTKYKLEIKKEEKRQANMANDHKNQSKEENEQCSGV